MPQMSPLMWLFLFLGFIMAYFLFGVLTNYYIYWELGKERVKFSSNKKKSMGW